MVTPLQLTLVGVRAGDLWCGWCPREGSQWLQTAASRTAGGQRPRHVEGQAGEVLISPGTGARSSSRHLLMTAGRTHARALSASLHWRVLPEDGRPVTRVRPGASPGCPGLRWAPACCCPGDPSSAPSRLRHRSWPHARPPYTAPSCKVAQYS